MTHDDEVLIIISQSQAYLTNVSYNLTLAVKYRVRCY